MINDHHVGSCRRFHTVNGQPESYYRLAQMKVEDWLNLAHCAERRAFEGVVVDGSPYSPKRETETRDAMIRRCMQRLDEWAAKPADVS